MTVRIRTITFDCRDPYLLAGFWSQVTGFAEDPGDTNHPDDPEGLLLAPDGSLALLFIGVPEKKQVKNRSTWTWPRPARISGTRRSAGSRRWARPLSMTGASPMAPDGSCSPTRRATSSASSAASRGTEPQDDATRAVARGGHPPRAT